MFDRPMERQQQIDLLASSAWIANPELQIWSGSKTNYFRLNTRVNSDHSTSRLDWKGEKMNQIVRIICVLLSPSIHSIATSENTSPILNISVQPLCKATAPS